MNYSLLDLMWNEWMSIRHEVPKDFRSHLTMDAERLACHIFELSCTFALGLRTDPVWSDASIFHLKGLTPYRIKLVECLQNLPPHVRVLVETEPKYLAQGLMLEHIRESYELVAFPFQDVVIPRFDVICKLGFWG